MPDYNPLFTIITPTYNSEAYISRLLASVRAQTFQDFEHLLIDGLSKDNTLKLLTDYCKEMKNCYVTSEKDNGIYDAMNKGIARARGKWIYFIGSDDYFFSKDVLAGVAIRINKLENVEFLYGNVWFEKYNKEYDGAYSISKILGQNICHQAIFYKRTIFEKVGNFELKYPQLADYQFNLKCWFDSTINIKYVPITVCFFSIGGASTSQSDNAFLKDYPSNILRFSLESNFNSFKKIITTAACLRKIFIRYSSLHYCKSYLNNGKNVFILLASLSVMFCSLPYYFIKTKIFCHSK